MAKTPYDADLDRNPANFQPLTPLSFLERATPPSSTARASGATPSSTPAPAGSPARSPRAGSSAATPSR